MPIHLWLDHTSEAISSLLSHGWEAAAGGIQATSAATGLQPELILGVSAGLTTFVVCIKALSAVK